MKEKLSHLWTFLLQRSKVATLLLLIVLVAGTGAFRAIPREITPTIDIPIANIMTVWPGASPGDVEKLITNKIEKKIKTLDNVEQYTSVSFSGLSLVTVEFELGTSTLENMQKLREEIDNAKRDLPASLPNDPQINEISMSDVPILSLTLSGDFAWSELKQFAETIEEELESIPKIKEVTVSGAPEDKVHIFVDPVALQAQGLGIDQVLQALRSSHQDMPLGQIAVDGEKIEVTLQAELEKAEDFLDLPITIANGSTVFLRDFAEVRREFDAFEVETYFSTEKISEPSVLISMTKSGSKGNVITMVENALSRIETLSEKELIPYDLDVNVTFNRADDIQDSLNTLTGSGRQTLILIAIVMLLALGWRESLLASLSIPVSLLIGIIVLYLSGRSFNGISLFALVLSVGLLVDNAIIIVEGMSEAIHERKMKPFDAAIHTLKTFRWPIIAGTLTTVFAFLPMLFFITGISGQYVSVIPITVMAVLFGALFVSLFLLPSLGVKFYEKIPPKTQSQSKILTAAHRWYAQDMRPLLESGWKTIGVLLLSTGVFVWSLSLVGTGKVPIEVFPASDQTIFAAEVEFPEGTPLEETRKLIPAIEAQMAPYFNTQPTGDVWLESYIFTVGKGSTAVQRDASSSIESTNILGITFNLTDTESRETSSYEIVPLVKKSLEDVMPGYVEFRMLEDRGGPPTGSALQVRFLGNDLPHLESLLEQTKSEVESWTEVTNISDSRAEKITQLTWRLKREELQRFGLSAASILEALRASVNGVTVVQLTEGDEEIDVDLKVDWNGDKQWSDPQSLDILNQIPLKTRSGDFIRFQQIAEATPSSELSQVQHRNGLRVMTLSADMNKGYTASQIQDKLQDTIAALDTQPGEIVEIGGDTEEGNRIITEMLAAMAAALLLIFLVLVAQFNSFYQPLVILALIPFSLTSVFIGFWILQVPIGFPTMIGILALAGIIVNDAIVLIDQINHQHHTHKKGIIDGYIDAAKSRMQPIFLTSVTTVVGLLPLSLSDEVWMGLGFAIIFGMIFSTILTLILTPAMLITLRRIKRLFVRLGGGQGERIE